MEWFTAPEYWLSRLLLERGIAVIYLIAFIAAARQFRPLLGTYGMLPVPRFVRGRSVKQTPSIFVLHYSDRFFATVCWSGAALAVAHLAGLTDAVPLVVAMASWLVLWLIYLSVVNVGQAWYSFGWESMLLESGFLAIFLGNNRVGPPIAVIFLARWLVFRIEFGAGLIKLRGDSCWRDLTCLYFHHETQPMPGPLSWFFHHLPKPLHRVETAANHFAQLVAPFGLFAPQPVATVAAVIIIATQLWLVASGNFAWLNWLTMILVGSAIEGPRIGGAAPGSAAAPQWFVALVVGFVAAVAVLSYWPVRNLVSSRQRMNASFNPFHLVNSYGAFGTVSRVRREVVIEGTRDTQITDHTVWREYGFKGKPGALDRMPAQWAPYHLRLDWLMWFAAISPPYAQHWREALVTRLLNNDPDTLKLLRHNPFPGDPPRYVRALLYRYRFSTWSELRRQRNWWQRTLIGIYLPPMALHDG